MLVFKMSSYNFYIQCPSIFPIQSHYTGEDNSSEHEHGLAGPVLYSHFIQEIHILGQRLLRVYGRLFTQEMHMLGQ